MVVVQPNLGMILKRNCNMYRLVVLWSQPRSTWGASVSSHQSGWTAFEHCQTIVIIAFIHLFILSCSSLIQLPTLGVSIYVLLFYLPLSENSCLSLSCLDVTYSVIEFIHAEVPFVLIFFHFFIPSISNETFDWIHPGLQKAVKEIPLCNIPKQCMNFIWTYQSHLYSGILFRIFNK
jgi:hypothetical protein